MSEPLDLLRQFDARASNRANWETLWSLVARMVIPRLDDILTEHMPGTERNLDVGDAFPQLALGRFAAALESGLVPRTSLWHNASTGHEEMDLDIPIAKYLEDVSKTLWRLRYRPRSNFSGQVNEYFTGLGAFGTSVMYVEPVPNGTGAYYMTLPLRDCYIATNQFRQIDSLYRRVRMTARQCVQKFGKDAPKDAHDALQQGKPDEKVGVYHFVAPRVDFEPGRLDDIGMPFTDWYVTRCEGGQFVREKSGYHEFPFAVARYQTATYEDYGRSPAIFALPDIRMLQVLKTSIIDQVDLSLDPPILTANDRALSEFAMTPGTIQPGGIDDNGRPAVMPVNLAGRVDIGLELLQDVRTQIDDGFLGLYFRTLVENPSMTATQAMLLAQQQGQLMAPMVGRLQTEFLDPLLRREAGIAFRQGLLPEVPGKLAEYLKARREPLSIVYDSPMTRAIESEGAAALLRSFEALAPLAQQDPNVFRRIDMNEAVKIILKGMGAPASAIKSDDDMEVEKEQQAAMEMAQMALQAAPVAAQTAKDLATAQNQLQSNPQV